MEQFLGTLGHGTDEWEGLSEDKKDQVRRHLLLHSITPSGVRSVTFEKEYMQIETFHRRAGEWDQIHLAQDCTTFVDRYLARNEPCTEIRRVQNLVPFSFREEADDHIEEVGTDL